MKQVITRMDDHIHAQLKALAAAEQRSVNEVVIEAVLAKLNIEVTRGTIKERLRAAGKLVVPPTAPGVRPSRESVIASGHGWGTAVSEALAAERAAR